MIPNFSAAVLYTRRGCHLCEQAEDMLEVLLPAAVIRDVDAAGDARMRYHDRVPVLEIDGAVVMEGRFDERVLAAWLATRATGRG